MNLKKILNKYFEKSQLAFMKTIPFKRLIFDKRAEYMCKYGCKNYNRKYSCPPYTKSLFNLINKNKFKWVILFATSYKNLKNYSLFKIRFENIQKEYEIQRISHQLSNLINFNGKKNKVFSGGSCKRCRPCGCIEDKLCKKPHLKQISMESIQIDCIKTMTNVGFDFQLTNNNTINRCGCIFTNDDSLSNIEFKKKDSHQKFEQFPKSKILKSIEKYKEKNPKLYSKINFFNIDEINRKEIPICNEECRHYNRNFSCPPYSEYINLNLWTYALVWKWKKNKYKKYRYNIALKKIHKLVYSMGYYFALSIRDCYCDECERCTYNSGNKSFCENRKILSPSMQSLGIDPEFFGKGKYGIEIF